jgi:poly-gamma-glutamate synthesis protein (capsule biosynthesis protein)
MVRSMRYGVAALLALGLVAACSTAEDDPERTGGPPAVGPASGTPSGAEPTQPRDRPVELALVGHATLPQLDVRSATLERLGSGAVDRWRGKRVVVGLRGPASRQAVRAVEQDAGTVAVVPLEAVGSTVVAATVDGADPVRDRDDAVTLLVAGDVMLVRGVADPAASLAATAPLLRRADLTVGNLESTLSTDGSPTQGGDSFGGDPSLLGVLRRAGFDALSLANNHVGDYGPQALVQTVRTLADSAIAPFGAGAQLRSAARPAVLEAGGVRFAFLGFNAIGETPAATTTGPGALSVRMPPRTGPLVQADLDRVTQAIRRADRQADAVVVLPHWGEQYTHRPWPQQRRVARALVAAGADLVVGGHPHWVQGMDAVDGVPVLHSLGNFVFDMWWEPQVLEGVLLETTWWGPDLKAIRLVPYAMDAETFTPRVVDGDRAADILGDVRSTSTGPYAR